VNVPAQFPVRLVSRAGVAAVGPRPPQAQDSDTTTSTVLMARIIEAAELADVRLLILLNNRNGLQVTPKHDFWCAKPLRGRWCAFHVHTTDFRD